MAEIKSAFEKAMERANAIGAMSAEEKATLAGKEKINAVLAAFYKGEIGKDKLWERLKGSPGALIRDAQHRIADSLRLGSAPEEAAQRKDGILALEALKERNNSAVIEEILHELEAVRNEYDQNRKAAIEDLRRSIEKNPQLRMKPVRLPDGRTAMQPVASVDEAVQARVAEMLDRYDKQYEAMFSQGMGMLKNELK